MQYTIYLAERNKVNGGWTNVQPRIYVGQLANKASAGGKLTKLESTILRGQSAQANGFENVPLFGLTMLIGTYAKLPSHTLNRTTALYLVGRIIYNWLYLTTETKKNSYWRTLVFNTSMFALIRIIVLSTLRINGLY
ncbi:hypothetical protein OC846_004179 [Tilletia horrida]|uniref:Uncharacterized protein n=1 Tax=Tilletia horrida TaxID=155126 RepID=A0AAN6GTD9_9BASI|nr:hypothetical protein OC846_004179 [Tilletia horrida]